MGNTQVTTSGSALGLTQRTEARIDDPMIIPGFDRLDLSIDDVDVSMESALAHCSVRFCAGENLESVVNHMESYKQRYQNQPSHAQNQQLELFSDCLMQTCCNLMGHSRDPSLLRGGNSGKDDATMLGQDHDTAESLLAQLKGHTKHIPLPPIALMFCTFYEGLVAAASAGDPTKSKKQHRKYLNVARKQLDKLRRLSFTRRSSPRLDESVLKNKLYLLEAEIAACTGHWDEALLLYHKSIDFAEKEGFLHEQGLAYEKAGRMLEVCGDRQLDARLYLIQARTCYEHWGAYVKVDQLDQHISAIGNTEFSHIHVQSR